MLRRKLMLVHGSLIMMLLIAALSAILLINNVLRDLDRISVTAMENANRTATLGASLNLIEAELQQLRLDQETHLDELLDSVQQLDDLVHDLKPPRTDRWDELLGLLSDQVKDLVTARDPQSSEIHMQAAQGSVGNLRNEVAAIRLTVQEQIEQERTEIVSRFRWMALGLGLIFLLVINVSIFVLLRATSMILSPIDQLVEASRRLAREDFDYRVEIDQKDEFGELARASNRLAEQLKRNEQMKIETLHHVARTLNHELNNAISVIGLQLDLVARSAGADPAQEAQLRQIQETLQRMSSIVHDFTRIRRIILTDYTPGVKMLDLQKSVEPEPTASLATSVPSKPT